uniref:EGF-like domain-containing protein n=1 Tax=Plectus sambesii TaxID=2011161 RepID=A0A914XFA6_9BILA
MDHHGRAFCKCDHGFTGRCCESFVPKPCKLYSDENTEDIALMTCDENFWCIPFNFNCHFFKWENCEGWCIPLAFQRSEINCTHYADHFQRN